MKAIRLVNGHFDGETERVSGEPQERLHKRLPHGEWVDSLTGLPVTHVVYRLSTDGNAQPVYTCTERAIEKSTAQASNAEEHTLACCTWVVEKYGSGTPTDWFERHLVGRLQWLGLVTMLVLDVYLFGHPSGGLVWLGQLVWVPLWAAGVVNGLGHAAGYRNFDIRGASHNILPSAVWLGGEELHNNHHADPASARFKARWFEFDIGWTYLRLLSLAGLARVLRCGRFDSSPSASS
jgi:fatty-acid desaturase